MGTPAEVATEAPTPTPTPAPAIPFAPEVDCQLIEGGALPVAGDITWSFQDCTVTWETENVSDVALHAWSEAAGWQVIAVTADELGYQDLLDASDGRLSLTDSTPDDDAFTSSRFYLGTQLGCTSPTEAAIALDLTATSTAPVAEDEAGNPLSDEPGETVVETAEMRSLVVDGTAATAPNVTISSVSFSAVENSLNATSTGGSIELTYDDAPARCGWELVITFTDFTNGSQVIPAAGLTATGVTGLDGIGFSSSEGAISIVSPTRDRAMPTSGVIVISMELLLDGFVLGGDYGTTVVAQTIASP